MELAPGRLKDLRAEVVRKDGVFLCHRTLDKDTAVVGPGSAAVCSGWMALGDHPAELQIALRLDSGERGPQLACIDWIDPEEGD
jgi:hypothetical protein